MVTSAELPFQKSANRNFPTNADRQQRRQAVMQAAENLAIVLHAGDRLTKALNLVLANAVTIKIDGTAQVHSGQRTYIIPPAEGCPCEDAKRRTRFCKHYIAMLIAKRAAALLQGTQHASGQELSQDNSGASASVSSGHIHEAPVACTLTFVCKGVDVHPPCVMFRTMLSSPASSAFYPKFRRNPRHPPDAGNSESRPSLKMSRTFIQGNGKNHEPKSR